jgi:hypothetical protein
LVGRSVDEIERGETNDAQRDEKTEREREGVGKAGDGLIEMPVFKLLATPF